MPASPAARLRALFRHRRAIGGLSVLIAMVLLLATAGTSEARGAPAWLSRWVRVMTGRDEQLAVASDTVVVFGPKTLSLGTATTGTFVERFTVTATPAAGSGYTLHLTNGPNGAAPVSGGSIAINGVVVAASTDLAALAAGASLDVPVQLQAADTIVAQLSGPAGAAVSVTVLAAPDPTFTVFGPRTYERASGAPVMVREYFSLPAGATAPAWLCIRNGDLDGTHRAASATVLLNGVEVIGAAEVSQQVAGYRKRVLLQRDNVLEVEVKAEPGSRLTLCAIATDGAPPVIALAAPLPRVVTRASTIDATGVVEDQTAVRITANGVPATVSATRPGHTSFTATVPLPLEGANRVAVTAIDAAGNRADSVRTVIRDTEAPVVTLNGLPDTATFSRDSAITISGTITDRTAITANVNGIPLSIDSVTHAFTQRVALARGANFITLSATDAAGNTTTLARQVTRDDVPPVLTVDAPAEGFVTREAMLHVTGSVTDATPVVITANGAALTQVAGGAFAGDVPLVVGSNALTVVAIDAAGNRTEVTRTVVRDVDPPVVTMTSPSDGVLVRTATVTVRGAVADASAVTATLNGVPLVLGADGAYASTIALSEGVNLITLVATDAAGNATTTTRSLTLDTTAPALAVSAPADAASTTEESVTVSGTATDAHGVAVTVNGSAATVGAGGAFSASVTLAIGTNTITVVATDSAGNSASVVRSVTRSAVAEGGLPPDPKTVAPALSRTVATTVAGSTAFLYTGANPIQTGVAAGTIKPYQASVVRGRLITRDGQPLPGATVSVLDRPEFGQTLSRADGGYDLAVNGGETIRLVFARAGTLGAQRQVVVPRQEWVTVEDAALIALDSIATVVDFSQPVTVARGSVMTDASGPRRATLMFPQGTQASMVLPGGTVQPLGAITVRATEYTVGPNGPAAMPGSLPPTTAYTYAAEFSVDEAIAAGATSVRFSKPVGVYVENFIGFPVGGLVPVATYDRVKGLWVPDPNGRVVKVLSIDGGSATLDLDGKGVPATESALAALGIGADELARVAELYQPGQSLWRVPTTHFSAMDFNWSPPNDPREPAPKGPPPTSDGGDKDEKKPDDQCKKKGSIIGCDRRTLGEAIAIAGTPITLTYTSERTPGYRPDYGYDVPLTTNVSDVQLSRMRGVLLRVTVAGRTTVDSFPAQRGLTHHVAWDGYDAYGRLVHGRTHMRIDVGYVYEQTLYAAPLADTTAVFGRTAGDTLSVTMRAPRVAWQTVLDRMVGGWTNGSSGMGEWSVSSHHDYDPSAGVLHLGNGERRSASSLNATLQVVGPPNAYSYHHTVTADGSIIYSYGAWMYRIAPDGTRTVFGGTGNFSYSGDGVPATEAGIFADNPVRGPDGSIYFSDFSYRIRRIDPRGIVTTIAGTGVRGGPVDGKPALQTTFYGPAPLAVGPDGSVYTVQPNAAFAQVVFRIAPDGIVTRFAGTTGKNCTFAACLDSVPALEGAMSYPQTLAVKPNGDLVIGDQYTIWNVSTSGVRTRLTKTPTSYTCLESGDGGPASQASICNVDALATGPDGSIYFASNRHVRRISPDGIITTVAGSGKYCYTHTAPYCPATPSGSALQTPLPDPRALAVTAEGTLVVYDNTYHRFTKLIQPLPGFDGNSLDVASEDGSELYRFSSEGRHLSTQDAIRKVELQRFGYDSVGQLSSITDVLGNVTMIERGADGAVQAIIGPYGQRTEMTLDAAGHLASLKAPGGAMARFRYSDTGLLLGRTDAAGGEHQFAYDDIGMLVSDTDPDGLLQTARTSLGEAGKQVILTTGPRQKRSYLTEALPAGGYRRLVTDASGLQSTTIWFPADSIQHIAPDGTVRTTINAPGAQFGMQAPLATERTRLPSGLTRTVRMAQALTLANTNDPLSLLTRTDSLIENGNVSTTVFAAVPRTITARTPEGRVTITALDSLGRPVSAATGGLATSAVAYDARGRITRTISAGRTTTLKYDALGQLASMSDALGTEAYIAHDSGGRVLAVRDTVGEVRFSYDNAGHLQTITPAGRPTHTFHYTPGGQLETYTAPSVPGVAGTTTSYRLDSDRNIRAVVRPDGDSVTFAYDSAGRPVRMGSVDGVTTFAYSAATGLLQTVADSLGASYTITYDGDLLTGISLNGGEVRGTLGWKYDNFLRPVGIAVNGDTVLRRYDRDGMLVGAGALGIVREAATGLVTTSTLGGIETRYRYDSTGSVTGATTTSAGASLYRYDLERDALGRVTRRIEIVEGDSVDTRFAYDAGGRLATVTRNGSETTVYEYDANGNRLRRTSATGVELAVVDAQDRLTTYGVAEYRYTDAGELAQRIVGTDTTIFHYDANGALRWVRKPDGTRIDYIIDPTGRRVGKRVNGVLAQGFLYESDLRIAAELDSTGSVRSRFVYGIGVNVPEYVIRGGTQYRIVTDLLGSVRLVVNVTTGAVMQRLDYDEYGRVLTNTNPGFQPFGYAGGLLDDATGLVRFGARDYDPVVARFTVKDPAQFDGGDPNLYRYVRNDPLNRVDPRGKDVMLAGALLGGINGGMKYLNSTKGCKRDLLDFAGSTLKGAAVGFAAAGIAEVGMVVFGTSMLAAATSSALSALYTNGAWHEDFSLSQLAISTVAGTAFKASDVTAQFESVQLRLGLIKEEYTFNEFAKGGSEALLDEAGKAAADKLSGGNKPGPRCCPR